MGKIVTLNALAARREYRARADACRKVAERYYLDGDMENFAAWATVTRKWYQKAEELMESDHE